ncbi:hypothetical protein [Streptomyces sp. NPDC101166]|uniref:hypothetical protein n=1 Tax=Streptomyces sp. NPDC101166 TaxID=3366120 RepID=UPI0037F997DE
MKQRRWLQRIVMLLTVLAGIITFGYSTAQASDTCKDIGNGRLCVAITPVNAQGAVQVIYTKTGGPIVYGRLGWNTKTAGGFGSPDIYMWAGHTYYHTWPTWVGPGYVQGVLWTADRRFATDFVKVV